MKKLKFYVWLFFVLAVVLLIAAGFCSALLCFWGGMIRTPNNVIIILTIVGMIATFVGGVFFTTLATLAVYHWIPNGQGFETIDPGEYLIVSMVRVSDNFFALILRLYKYGPALYYELPRTLFGWTLEQARERGTNSINPYNNKVLIVEREGGYTSAWIVDAPEEEETETLLQTSKSELPADHQT